MESSRLVFWIIENVHYIFFCINLAKTSSKNVSCYSTKGLRVSVFHIPIDSVIKCKNYVSLVNLLQNLQILSFFFLIRICTLSCKARFFSLWKINCYGYAPRHVSDKEAMKLLTLRLLTLLKPALKPAWRILSGIEVELSLTVSISRGKMYL